MLKRGFTLDVAANRRFGRKQERNAGTVTGMRHSNLVPGDRPRPRLKFRNTTRIILSHRDTCGRGRKLIKRLFQQVVDAVAETDPIGSDPEARDRAIRRATAVLMLDVALADKVFDERELGHLQTLAESHFHLAPGEARELIDTARSEAEELVSLHEFTQLLHQHLTEEEKAAVVGMLWRIAYADGKLDKYENSLVLKISDLLYVSRGRVMRLKHDAELAAGRA